MRHVVSYGLVGALVGWVVAGKLGLGAGLAIGAATAGLPRLVLAGAVAGPVMMGIVTLTEASLDERFVRVFPVVRPRAHETGLLTVILWIGAATIVWNRPGPEPTLTGSASRRRSPWLLCVLVVLAVVGTLLSIE